MSLMKQYAQDSEELTFRAMETAWSPCPIERATGLSRLFRDCGDKSLVYHSPAEVFPLFVHIVQETYSREFKAQQEGKVA